MAITIVHKPNSCHFPQLMCKNCLHKQYIFDGGVSFCVKCQKPFQMGVEAYALVYEEINERFEFFTGKLKRRHLNYLCN